MAVNHEYQGRTFPATSPYEVSRVKIAEFADAIGDGSALYRDPAAAQAAGYRDVIAPPTFPIVVTLAASGQAIRDPGFGLNYARVVHGEQRFSYSRPIEAGDVLTAEVTISSIRQAGSNVLVTTETVLRAAGGEHVCTAHSTLAERGGSA